MKVCPARVNELRLRFKQRVISLQKQQRRISPKVFSFIGGTVTMTTRLSRWKKPRVCRRIASMFFVSAPGWNGDWAAGQKLFATSSEQPNSIREIGTLEMRQSPLTSLSGIIARLRGWLIVQ